MTTLVLLPGMDGTGALFAPLLAQLDPAIKTQVVAYPGHEKLDYSDLADRVETALPKRGPFVLLGESFSGPVAIAVAARKPARLRGLILACSFARAPLPALAPLRGIIGILPPPHRVLAPMGMALMGTHATPALRQALAQALAQVDPDVLRHRAAATMTVDASALLASVPCPVLYLQAADDRVVTARNAQHVLRCAPHTQVVRLAGPHFLLQTRPQAAASAIETFLNGL